jgi:glyoxylase I family protein
VKPPLTSSLHHIALGADDVERVSTFYAKAFSLREVTCHHDEGGLRSIWLEIAPGAVLMIEKSSSPAKRVEGIGHGPFLLAFRIAAEEREAREKVLVELGAAIESTTEFSSYARDPEGNRIALSYYPLPGSEARVER